MFNRIKEGMYWDVGWRLVEGCTLVSAGCDNCWSRSACHMRKFQKNEKIKEQYPFDCTDDNGNWTGKIHCLKQNLNIPLEIKKPTVFAIWNDLFHENVPDTFILSVWERMALCPQHTFIMLTKRPEKMKHEISEVGTFNFGVLPNVWLGVTAENQEQADKRIPILLDTSAAKRFVSVEPMLSKVDLLSGLLMRVISLTEISGIDWVVCGGETGTKARPINPDWIRFLRDQCKALGIPFYFKQWGEWFWNPFFKKNCKQDSSSGHAMYNIGRKVAGREIDGLEWNELPEINK